MIFSAAHWFFCNYFDKSDKISTYTYIYRYMLRCMYTDIALWLKSWKQFKDFQELNTSFSIILCCLHKVDTWSTMLNQLKNSYCYKNHTNCYNVQTQSNSTQSSFVTTKIGTVYLHSYLILLLHEENEKINIFRENCILRASCQIKINRNKIFKQVISGMNISLKSAVYLQFLSHLLLKPNML